KKFLLACIDTGEAKVTAPGLTMETGDDLIKTFLVDYTNTELPEKLTLVCGTKSFDISFTVTPPVAKLPQPEIDLSSLSDKNVLHIATSVSLVAEMNANAIVMGVGYLVGHGFIPYNYSWI